MAYSDTALYEIAHAYAHSTAVECVNRHMLDMGNRYRTLSVPGGLFSRAIFLEEGAPGAELSLLALDDLVKVLDDDSDFGDTGSVFETGRVFSSTKPFHLHWAKKDPLGGYTAGSVHPKWTFNHGSVLLQQIQASQGALAVASLAVRAVDDGTNPIVAKALAAMPAVTELSGDRCYTLAKLELNSVEVKPLQAVTFSPNINLRLFGAAGSVYPKYGFVGRGAPVFQVQLSRPTTLYDLGITGLEQQTNLVQYFQRCDPYGARELPASAVHVKATMRNVAVSVPGGKGGAIDEMMTDRLTIALIGDGTANPQMVWAADQAIT